MKQTPTQQRVTKILFNMLEMVKFDQDYAEMFSDMLEDGLNDLEQGDCFGTEGQTDPRGDQRDINDDDDDDPWSMTNVQGVDS